MGLEKYVEKEVLFSEYGPGRKIAEFVIVVKNVPGAFAKISQLAAEMGINILSGFIRAKASEETAVWSGFVDLTDAKLEVENVARRLKKLDVVLDVKSSGKVGELVVDELSFPVTLAGERYVLFKVESVGEAFEKVFSMFGSGAATILYNMGLKTGVSAAETVMRKYGLRGRRALDVVLKQVIAKGWAVPEIEVFDEKRKEAVVRAFELFECLPFKGKLKEPRSHLARGYIAGVFKAIFGVDFTVVETECLAKGDPYCRFMVTQHSGKQESI